MSGLAQPSNPADSQAPVTTRSAEATPPDGTPSQQEPWPEPTQQASARGLSIFQQLLILILSLIIVTLALPTILRQALLSSAIALFLGAAGAFWIAGRLGDRLKAVARVADTVHGGVLDAREEQRRLELLILERTRELDSRNADLRLVLDHLEQGFLTLGRDAKMSSERSAILGRWLGPAPESELFADYLGQVSASTGARFAKGWDRLMQERLPLDLLLEQLPKSVHTPERTIHIGYRAIRGTAGALTRMLVVLSDITPELERVSAVDSLSTICHQLQEQLSQDARLSPEQLAPLARRWTELTSKLQAVLDRETASIQMVLAKYEGLTAVAHGQPASELLLRLADGRHEPVRVRLLPLEAFSRREPAPAHPSSEVLRGAQLHVASK